MSNFKQAAEGIKNFAGRVRGFLEAADFLDHVGDIELAEKEALNRRDAALKDEAIVQNRLSDLKSEVMKWEAESEKARNSAIETKINAEAAANSLVSAAREKAVSIISEARADLSRIKDKIAEENKELQSVKARIEEEKEDIAVLDEKIRKAKETINKMLVA